ncbi:PBIP1 protein, partial [Atlantisia rogersi]|nr:PBIP1 protein [Atlantisia rogersi]
TPSSFPGMDKGTCGSTDDDDDDDDDITKGLRRRSGHEPPPGPPPPVSVPHRGPQGAGDEDGLNVSKYLLGALALVAVGLLIVSGEWGVPGEGWGSQEQGEGPGSSDSKPPTPPHAGDPQTLQSMSILLDKLAKENQEIRLMQAELQAHKEELLALLRKSEGEAAATSAQHQSLAAKNARLTAALEWESAALRRARAELDQLRAGGTPGSPPHLTDPKIGQPPSVDPKAHGEHAARRWDGSQHRGGV